jgi:hypothetical protein
MNAQVQVQIAKDTRCERAAISVLGPRDDVLSTVLGNAR